MPYWSCTLVVMKQLLVTQILSDIFSVPKTVLGSLFLLDLISNILWDFQPNSRDHPLCIVGLALIWNYLPNSLNFWGHLSWNSDIFVQSINFFINLLYPFWSQMVIFSVLENYIHVSKWNWHSKMFSGLDGFRPRGFDKVNICVWFMFHFSARLFKFGPIREFSTTQQMVLFVM